jgi:hypothetical protein
MRYPDAPELAGQAWLDAEAGPVVRPYAVTRNRSGTSQVAFDLLAFVTSVPGADPGLGDLLPEHRKILAQSQEPISIAELASYLDLALGVVRLLLGDLVDEGLVLVQDSAPAASRPSSHVLKAVIHGLREL